MSDASAFAGEDDEAAAAEMLPHKKWPRLRGHSPLVLPVTVVPDDYPVAIASVPAAMVPAVMIVEFGSRAAVITVAIIVAIATDAEIETLSACHCRSRNCDDR
jgi:hypothetical protein